MRALVAALALLLAAAPALAAEPAPRSPDPSVTMVEADDPQMNAAMAEARRTLPEFWRMYDSMPAPHLRASLKLRFAQGDDVEFMWIGNVRRENGVITGVLNNTPLWITNVARGDRITVDPAAVADWTFVKAGQTYGDFTTRVLLDRMPPEKAAQIRQGLSKTPLETQP